MPQLKKNHKVVSIRMDSDVYEELEKYRIELGITRTRAIEQLIDKGVRDHFFKRED